jgi:peptide/nickel transport system ATP-binding protein
MSLLEIENLKTYYFTRRGVVKATDGVSFSVNKGEAFGLAGESGCGKTTTAFSIMKLVPPPGRITEGKMLFEAGQFLRRQLA